MSQLLRLALLAALALSLVAAGCGDDTAAKNEYVDAVNKAQTDFAAAVQKIQADASSASPDQAKQVFDDLAGEVDNVVSDLEAVEPPEEVSDLHNRLVDQMGSFGDSIREAGDSIDGGDPQAIIEATTKFSQEVSKLGTDISTTINEINQQLQG
jgi:peptidoglycan hydrolase CwlO-like protein